MKSIRNRFLDSDFIPRVLPGGRDQQGEGAEGHCATAHCWSLELRASIPLSSVEVSLAQRTGGDVIMIIFISNFTTYLKGTRR